MSIYIEFCIATGRLYEHSGSALPWDGTACMSIYTQLCIATEQPFRNNLYWTLHCDLHCDKAARMSISMAPLQCVAME